MDKNNLKYLPTLGELIDRLTISQLKEVFISDKHGEYAQEIQDIVNDINVHLEGAQVNNIGQLVRAICVLMFMNREIWLNESNYRKGIKDGNNLELTHGLNGIRNTAKNVIQDILTNGEGRKDYKIDCMAAADETGYKISW